VTGVKPETSQCSQRRAPWVEIAVLPDAESAAREAAVRIAAAAREAIRDRGRCLLALSGGRAAEAMLHALAREPLDWGAVHVAQVDERVAPAGSDERNLSLLQRGLSGPSLLPRPNLHAMPVDDGDLDAAAERYAATLAQLAGSPPVLDVVHLGIGADGHTASLAPGDPVLSVTDAEVAVTGLYRGRRRMTLTLPALNRARRIVWLVTGADKAPVLARLQAGDATLPASRIAVADARLYADREAAALLGPAMDGYTACGAVNPRHTAASLLPSGSRT